MKTQTIQLKKPTKETLIAIRQSAQKFAQLLKAHNISEDDIIAEFNAMRKQARRDAIK
jgi:hypothetical protein